MTKAPDQSCVCFICHRRADGVGFGYRKWICDNESIKVAKALSKMSRDKIDKYEIRAIEHMIPILGEYVEKTGFDLSTWNEQQVFDFAKLAATQFGISMRIVCAELEAPF